MAGLVIVFMEQEPADPIYSPGTGLLNRSPLRGTLQASLGVSHLRQSSAAQSSPKPQPSPATSPQGPGIPSSALLLSLPLGARPPALVPRFINNNTGYVPSAPWEVGTGPAARSSCLRWPQHRRHQRRVEHSCSGQRGPQLEFVFLQRLCLKQTLASPWKRGGGGGLEAMLACQRARSRAIGAGVRRHQIWVYASKLPTQTLARPACLSPHLEDPPRENRLAVTHSGLSLLP